ncbi:hypothetical protein WOLCODRAFT_109674 [Wolfiporia cocos MD-104 SS10]|uniref:Aminoglycoside phosphotransferase domain-containing protein n=1 Tax=Wolfiporia cocos (strain MD-104) TaxID=742152 RepID=A0A2H3JHG2_WOLCO|nr:hypothetical protein WOLCODRAFT_109674 [Wolfiporia cocos MD-104 SS10]
MKLLSEPEVTREQIQVILEHHRKEPVSILTLERYKGTGFSSFTSTVTYEVALADDTSFLVKVSPPAASAAVEYAPNTLAQEHALLQQLSAQTAIPLPHTHALDTSLTLVPYPYLLLSRPRGVSLAHARTAGLLSARQALLLDLRLGALLQQLHAVQNDWFGLPAQAADGLYSWQEAFTLLLEGLLVEAEARGVPADYTAIRQGLSRAIAFFLFDDCEVPSLVSFAGDEGAVFVDIDAVKAEEEEVPVTVFLSFSHALWGDPLLETMLMDPSAALTEGYGGTLIVFPRQRTKRIWYTLFLALMVLVSAEREKEERRGYDEGKIEWARTALGRCIEQLKDAPYY